MKQFHGNSLIFATTTLVLLATQSAFADTAKVTQVQLKPGNGGVNVVLTTSDGSRPQVFTTKHGKDLVADIINTQLHLAQGNNFQQNNPVPGITSVSIRQLDGNSIRLVVTGNNNAPNTQPVARGGNEITLGFSPTNITQATVSTPVNTPQNLAQIPNQTTSQPSGVPHPQLSTDNNPAPADGPGQPPTVAPPFLPRAVAPPVGDIAVSNIDASPTTIDLGSQERVPRLVLRDAPVREVLSLLARAANLNLAYSTAIPKDGEASAATAAGDGPTISLDVQNESVQDVFNNVLRLSGLEASRNGRTIFVGIKLPNSTREMVMRNLRLNQVTVGVALNFLVGLGAESAISRERLVTSVNAVPVGNTTAAVTQTQTTTESKVETQRVTFTDSIPVLRGLQVFGDERTNSVTLAGPSKLVDIAVSQLTQLDIRRRQVAINVKIIDVNLLATKDFSSSFSFGIGNNFFSNDNGIASTNIGGVNPPTAGQVTTPGGLTPPIINNVYSGGKTFLNPNTSVSIPGTAPGTTYIDANGNVITGAQGSATFYTPTSPLGTGNPLQPGYSSITPATNNIVTIDSTGKASISQGTLGSVTTSLPSLYQFPKRFLSSLQAQVTNGNAKILTDPTLTVQEGQQALVNLTAQVFAGFKLTQATTSQSLQGITVKEPIIKDAGLSLSVKVDRIDDNGFVSLSVSPTVSSPSSTVPSSDGDITLISQRSLTSGQIRMRDGQTLILSGIIQDSDKVTVSKVPVLGDIPILGSLFRKTSKNNQRNEVIVLVTPQIIDDSDRSPFGYNYTPTPEVRQILEQRGLHIPKQ